MDTSVPQIQSDDHGSMFIPSHLLI